MGWKLTQHKRATGKQEVSVKLLLLEMAQYSYSTNADEFENDFKRRVIGIHRTNNFSADLMYRVTQRNPKSAEIWKLAPNGEFKYKMFTLDYVDE